jgi:hypothetical protein
MRTILTEEYHIVNTLFRLFCYMNITKRNSINAIVKAFSYKNSNPTITIFTANTKKKASANRYKTISINSRR